MSVVRILLVDDDRLVLATLGHSLRRFGYQVTEAVSGEEALSTLQSGSPHVAIVDIQMSGKSGLALARELRRKSNLPVIFLTACQDDETIREAAAIGAYGYLVKPVDGPQLRPTIEMVLALAREFQRFEKSSTQSRECARWETCPIRVRAS